MHRKFFLFNLLFIGMILLSGCKSKTDLSTYIDVDFYGYNTIGNASYAVDEDRLVNDIFEVNEENSYTIDYETQQEIENMLDSYSIEMIEESDLSNGDEVTLQIKVNEEMTDKLTPEEEVTVEVTGLEEAEELSDEEIEKNVVVNFNGYSGRGKLQIDTTFSGDLGELNFESSQDGEIKNGDTVTVAITEASKDNLEMNGYVLSGDGQVEFEASGLKVVAEEAKEIKNLEDIERMIDEGINRKFENSTLLEYEIDEGKTYYRQFEEEESDNHFNYDNTSYNGMLITVYSIDKYFADDHTGSLTFIYGYRDIILDENDQANVAKIVEYSKEYNSTYSLESVEKLIEGHGFTEVE